MPLCPSAIDDLSSLRQGFQRSGSAHPGLHRTARMLDRLAPPHPLGMIVEPMLDGLEDMLILPTREPALRPVVNWGLIDIPLGDMDQVLLAKGTFKLPLSWRRTSHDDNRRTSLRQAIPLVYLYPAQYRLRTDA